MFRFIIGCLALWRISSLLVEERGPYNIFRQIREKFGIVEDSDGQKLGYNEDNVIGMALTCTWCTSLWMAPAILLIEYVAPAVNDVLAMSAGAILVNEHMDETLAAQGVLNGNSEH